MVVQSVAMTSFMHWMFITAMVGLIVETASAAEIIAHRGASAVAPENTIASARVAFEQGADVLECDIYMTKDGKLAVIHDKNTKRTTGVDGDVEKMTMAEIQKLDAGSRKDKKFAGEKIPTLDELLAVIPDGKKIFIEIKGAASLVPALKESTERSGKKPEQISIICFNAKTLAAAKKAMPQFSIALLMDWKKDKEGKFLEPDKAIADCKAAGIDAVDLKLDGLLDAAFVKKVHEAGLKLYTWTVNDAAVFRKHIDAGVDGITTDKPALLKAELMKVK